MVLLVDDTAVSYPIPYLDVLSPICGTIAISVHSSTSSSSSSISSSGSSALEPDPMYSVL